jgi:hypothetical protein
VTIAPIEVQPHHTRREIEVQAPTQRGRTPQITSDQPATPVLPAPHSDTPRAQATIKRVAEILAYSDRYVRDLCNRGELETNGRRGRGLRIFLDSVAAYQRRNRSLS